MNAARAFADGNGVDDFEVAAADDGEVPDFSLETKI